MLLPPDLRDWGSEDHLVRFIVEAVGLLNLSTARVNHRGTGSDQVYPAPDITPACSIRQDDAFPISGSPSKVEARRGLRWHNSG